MKHIRSWQERVNEGDSIFAKATALEAEVAELRAYIEELTESPEAARRRLVEGLSPEERRHALLTMLLKKIQHSRIVRPVKQIRILPEELRELELAVKPWMIEKTENLGIRKFEGILLMEDHTAPSLLA